jgi:hypothetical protein
MFKRGYVAIGRLSYTRDDMRISISLVLSTASHPK